MINTEKALELFFKKYSEKYDEKIESGDTVVAVLKNCVMALSLDDDKKMKICFTPVEPIYIDENLDMYEEILEDE